MLPVGKLEPDFLRYLLQRYARTDDRVLVGAAVGEDATVIDFGSTCLIAKTDPITFATDEIGWYAVNVNANDIAVAGGQPAPRQAPDTRPWRRGWNRRCR